MQTFQPLSISPAGQDLMQSHLVHKGLAGLQGTPYSQAETELPLHTFATPSRTFEDSFSGNCATGSGQKMSQMQLFADHSFSFCLDLSDTLVVPTVSLFSGAHFSNGMYYSGTSKIIEDEMEIEEAGEEETRPLKFFRNDFRTIKDFFSNCYFSKSTGVPKFDLSRFRNQMSLELVDYLSKNRAMRKPKREQMFKKVLNYCFKCFINDYKKLKQPKLQHVNSELKKEFLAEYFPDVDQKILMLYFPLIIDDKRKQFFTYKSSFLDLIKNNSVIKQKLLFYMDQLIIQCDEIFEKDLYRFLLQMEHWSEKPDRSSGVEGFFVQKQTTKDGKVKTTGVKLPWSEEQLVNAVQILKLRLA